MGIKQQIKNVGRNFFVNFRIKSLGIESDYRNHSLSATWSDTKHYNIFDNSDLIILTASH